MCVQEVCHISLEIFRQKGTTLDIISMEGLDKKLWVSKVVGVPILRIAVLLWKMSFGCSPHDIP
jgi:hypothetical protein